MREFKTVYVDEYTANLVLLEVHGQNLNSSNRKLRLNYGDAQLTILPTVALDLGRDLFKGRGSLGLAQIRSCAHNCAFRVKDKEHPNRVGGCYVSHLGDKADKAKRAIEEGNPTLYLNKSALVRATVWGDIGRLSKAAQEYVKDMITYVDRRLVYISDTHNATMFHGLAQMSCQSKAQVLSALLSGWKVYAGTLEAAQALRELNASPVYRCPVKGNGLDKFGCAQCPIRCDGQRHVIAHSVGKV